MVELKATADEAATLAKFMETAASQAQAGGQFAKSLTTGNDVVTPGTTGGAALRPQDLAADIKNLTFGKNDFVMFNLVPRGRATSTAYEYNIKDGYGDTGSSRFVQEMEIADINDISYERKVVRMKIISDTRQMSILSAQVANVVNPMDELLDASMTVVAKTIEYGIFYGDADMSQIGEGQGNEFDGLKKLIPDSNVIDLRGTVLTELNLNSAAVRIAENYGHATSAFMPVGVQAAFVQNQLNRQWVAQGSAENLASGFNVPKFYSAQGAINLYPSTIMDYEKRLNTNAVIKPTAPAAPNVTATVADAAGRFSDADIASPLKYAVVVESAGSAKSAPTLVTAALNKVTNAVTLDVDLGAQIIGTPRDIAVYRFDVNSGAYYRIGRVPMYKATNVSGEWHVTFVDENDEIAGTSDVFIGELDGGILQLVELNSMQRLPLATVKAALQFTILWQGALALYAPKKWALLKNVKAQVM